LETLAEDESWLAIRGAAIVEKVAKPRITPAKLPMSGKRDDCVFISLLLCESFAFFKLKLLRRQNETTR
jgi:hypothetical protein